MGKKVTAYSVKSLNDVDPKNYIEGDLFITNRSIGILVNGKIKTFETSKPDLKDYVKKEDVSKMIEKGLKNAK